MEQFGILSKIEVDTKELAFLINEYKIRDLNSAPDIITSFFKPEFYKRDDFHSALCFNKSEKIKFLELPFNLKNITYKDFHKLSKSEALEFIWNNISIWKERQIEEEKILFNKVRLFIDTTKTDDYFVISKDFFDQSLDANNNCISDKLVFDATIYGYFFVVIWMDINNKILTVSQFLYD